MLSNVNNSTLVKICGLKDTATITKMNGLPVQYVGLVFAASKRQVSPLLGVELVQAIHQLDNGSSSIVEAVAVCVNMPMQELVDLVQLTALDIVQLHGHEDYAYITELREALPTKKVWKALSVKELSKLPEQIESLKTYIDLLDAIVIDAPGGGTGSVFNWEAIRSFQEVCKQQQCKLFVAGGLHEENVEQLLSTYEIDGVDVSSGVETNGVKDNDKIQRFVRKVRK